MKFRKKPVVVEAEQWIGPESKINGVGFRRPERGDDSDVVFAGGVHYVTTIHGQRADLAPGDWIITEPDGKHHYPCKPDIFEATYEAILSCGMIVGGFGEGEGKDIQCEKPARRIIKGSRALRLLKESKNDGCCDECFEKMIAAGTFSREECDREYPLAEF